MDPKIYEKMLKIRKADNLSLKSIKFLRDTITVRGKEVPFKLRNYQIQMVFHTLLSRRFVIGDDTGLGKCLTKCSVVNTSSGLVQIGDMHDWSRMQPETFEPIDRDWHVLVDGENLPVKNFYYGGVKPTVKMRSRYGFEVEGSRVHPILVRRNDKHQWVEMQDLQEGDYICVERREMAFPKVEPTLTKEVTTGSQSVPCNPSERVTYIQTFLDQNGRDFVTSPEITVPDFILRATRETNVEFLRWLFEISAQVRPSGEVDFSTASEEVGRVVQIMLTRFGIISKRHVKTVNAGEDNTNWRLTISGQDVRVFRDKIGFVSSRKREALDRSLKPLTDVNLEGVPNSFGTEYFYDPVVSLEDSEAEVFDIEVDDPRHCFVSNGILSHNTLEAITTIAALWEKDPDLKVIVVTNTSVMRQWGGEIDKFTEGIEWRVAEGGPEKRHAIYEDFFQSWDPDCPEVLIVNYHRLRRDKRIFRGFAEGHRYCLLLDECFDYHTPVTLADGSTELIGKIVSQQRDVEVLSYNFETGQVEPKKVVNWYRNPRSKSRGKDVRELLKIRFAHGNSVRCTYSHDFYMLDGSKKPACDLKVGDEVVHLVQNPASEEQLQIVMGGLLGDAGVSHPDRDCPGTVFCQGGDQEAYLTWKREALSSLGVSEVDTQPSSYKKTSFVHRFRVNSHPQITDRIKKADLYRSGRKRVSAEWLEGVTELGLAVWYGDDGSLKTYTTLDGEDRYQIMLHTQGFTLEENELLAGWLKWKWGVEAQVKVTTKKREDTISEYAYLYLPHEAAVTFLNLLTGSLPGVEYKFPFHDPYVFSHTPTHGVVEDRVVEIRRVTMQANEKYVYDIEVEDNHNYFAGGTLVSNCTAVKNPESQTHHVFRELSIGADRVYGLTATLIKNNLTEGFGIYRVIVPDLFRTQKGFYRNYCVTRMQRIPGSRRKIPVVIGHKASQIQAFRKVIDPYYLGRAKHHVADELPVLTIKDVSMPMEYSQHLYYQDALEGLLTLNEGTEEEEERETTKLTQLIYCQEIVNSPALIGNEVKSGKEDYFFQLLKEELEGEKVIVFTRFKEMVNRLQSLLEKDGWSLGIEQGPDGKWNPVESDDSDFKGLVRITGDEGSEERDAGRRAFTDTEGTQLIFLTMAGAEAINLQQARVMVFYDLPWSAGDYLQCLGRMIRIGSPHDRVYAIHLLSETPDGLKTIDHHVRDTLDKKMGYIEKTLGERLVTEDPEHFKTADDEGLINFDSHSTSDIFDLLVKDAQNGGQTNDT